MLTGQQLLESISLDSGPVGPEGSLDLQGGVSDDRRLTGSLESRVNRLAFQGQHTEHTFVHAAERLAANEAFEGLDA